MRISVEHLDFEKIVQALKSYYDGTRIDDICAELDINKSTFARWKVRYGSLAMDYNQIKKENEHLKKIYNTLFESHEMLHSTINILKEMSLRSKE